MKATEIFLFSLDNILSGMEKKAIQEHKNEAFILNIKALNSKYRFIFEMAINIALESLNEHCDEILQTDQGKRALLEKAIERVGGKIVEKKEVKN